MVASSLLVAWLASLILSVRSAGFTIRSPTPRRSLRDLPVPCSGGSPRNYAGDEGALKGSERERKQGLHRELGPARQGEEVARALSDITEGWFT